MPCQTETVQAREDREQEKDGAPEGDEEWAGPGAASVDPAPALADTVSVRTAD